MHRCLSCNAQPPTPTSPNRNKRSLTDFDETDGSPYLPAGEVESDLNSFVLLEDAIRRGDSNTALQSIQQQPRLLEESNHDGDTPLLLAARFNLKAVIGTILQTRSELVDQVDRRANNLLHLLAAHSNKEGMPTIVATTAMVSSDVGRRLMATPNQNGQTPLQVAESQDRCQYIDRITSELTLSNAR